MLAVFDLTVREALNLPEDLSTRVMLVYDKGRNVTEYTLLNDRLPEGLADRVTGRIKENVEEGDTAFRLVTNRLNGDCFEKSAPAQ